MIFLTEKVESIFSLVGAGGWYTILHVRRAVPPLSKVCQIFQTNSGRNLNQILQLLSRDFLPLFSNGRAERLVRTQITWVFGGYLNLFFEYCFSFFRTYISVGNIREKFTVVFYQVMKGEGETKESLNLIG